MGNEISGHVHGQVVQAGRVGRIDVHAAPAPLTALSGLPPATAVFCGREDELRMLRASWTRDCPAIVSSAVAGLAGIGKTELVLHAAHDAIAAGLFPGGVLFVDLQGYDKARRVTPNQALDSFLRALGVDGQGIPPQEDQRAALFRSILNGRPCMLILLDNASSTTQVRPLLPGSGHRVVITSRHTLSGLDEAQHLDVGVLSEAEAVELVGDARLAVLCGRLPLALRIMRALATADPHTDWVAELTDAQHRLELLDDGDSRAVHAAFDLSYRSLNDEQRRLFRLLSLHPTDEIALEGAAALIGLPPARTRVLLRELVRAHLVEPGTTPDWFTFHDLVRLYAHRCTAGDPENDAAITRMLDHYTTKTQAASRLLGPWLDPDREFFAGLKEALWWMNRCWHVLVAAARLAAAREQHDFLFPLVEGLCAHVDLYRRPDELVAVCGLAVQSARLAGNRSAEAQMLTKLGHAYGLTRNFEASIAHLEKSLELKRAIGDRFSLAATLNSLGTAYRKLSRLAEALACYREALQIRETIADRHGEGQTLNNLGNTMRAMGDTSAAALYYERSYHMRRELGDPHGEAQVLNNIGTNLLTANDIEQAISFYHRALRLYRDLGNQYRETDTLDMLGRSYHRAGDPGRARTAWESALAIYERVGAEQKAQDISDLIAELER